MKYYQDLGVLQSTLVEIPSYKGVEVYRDMPAPVDRAVVVPNCSWVATARGIPPKEAVAVYSGNDKGEVGIYNKNKISFTIKQLKGRQLINVSNLMLKTSLVNNEAERITEMNINTLDLNSLSQAVAQAPAIDPAQAFQNNVTEAAVQSDRDTQLINGKNGRLIAFITKIDSVTKATIVTPSKKTADGKIVKGADGKAQKEPSEIHFKNYAPSAPVGAIISKPVTSGGTIAEVLDKEHAMTTIAKEFGGYILEDERIVGQNFASRIELKRTSLSAAQMGKPANAGKTFKASFRLTKNYVKGRKTVLVDAGAAGAPSANYISLKMYKTGAYAKNAPSSIASVYVSKGKDKNFAPQFKDIVKDNVTTVASVNEAVDMGKFNQAFSQKNILRFDTKTAISSPQVPVYEKKTSKEGKVTFVPSKITDLEEIVRSPRNQMIVAATGLSQKDLKFKLSAVAPTKTRAAKEGTKTKEEAFDVADFLNNLDSIAW